MKKRHLYIKIEKFKHLIYRHKKRTGINTTPVLQALHAQACPHTIRGHLRFLRTDQPKWPRASPRAKYSPCE